MAREHLHTSRKSSLLLFFYAKRNAHRHEHTHTHTMHTATQCCVASYAGGCEYPKRLGEALFAVVLPNRPLKRLLWCTAFHLDECLDSAVLSRPGVHVLWRDASYRGLLIPEEPVPGGSHLLNRTWCCSCLAVRVTPNVRSCEAQSEDGRKAVVLSVPQSYPIVAKVARLEGRLIRRYPRAKEGLVGPSGASTSLVCGGSWIPHTLPGGALDIALLPCR